MFLPFDKFARAMRIMNNYGGIVGCLRKLAKMDSLKEGRLVGRDHLGNRYYQNNYYMVPRNRWVEFSDDTHWDYDASQVPPEWYGWLHHKTDALPSEDKAKYDLTVCQLSSKWLAPHEENKSATPEAYYPYRTTPDYMHVWDGEIAHGILISGTCVTNLSENAAGSTSTTASTKTSTK